MKKMLSLWLRTTLLTLTFSICFFGLNVPTASEFRPKKQPFTIEDSLDLETIRFSSQYGISPDGRYVAYALKEEYQTHAKVDNPFHNVPRGFHVYISSIESTEAIPITKNEEHSWSPSWSPTGERLAFYVWHKGKICIGLWSRSTNKIEYLALQNLTGKKTLEWSPQGDEIYYFPSSFESVGPIWPYESSEKIIIRKSWEKDSYEERFRGIMKSQLWVFDLQSKKNRPIIADQSSLWNNSLSPDGQHIAVTVLTKRPVIAHLVPSYVKLEVWPTKGGKSRIVFNDKVYTTPYSWSPDSQSIAYVDKGEVNIYTLSSGKTTSLGIPEKKIIGTPLWHPRGGRILCTAEGEDYFLNIDSGESCLLKMNTSLTKTKRLWDNSGAYLYVSTVNDKTGVQSIFKANVKTGRLESVIDGEWLIGSLACLDSNLYFTLQNQTTPENIWLIDLKTRQKKQITKVNGKMANRAFGRSKLVHWKSLSGHPLKGVLIYPADYVEAHKYPIVFWVYERFSHQLHKFFSHVYNLQILASKGYAVFLPDVKFFMGETARSFKESLVPAMDKLIEIGIADGNFGVMGRSFGGFATNIVITQTTRFKAAVTSCGITNWVSKNRMQGVFWRRGDQIGQGRLGGNLWKVRDNYIKNSPVFHLDKVETPILILHGTVDRNVHFSQAEEMYYGLRDLNKTAMLVAYPGETHLGWDAERWVHIDQWQRILAWFDRYLKN